ncbi:MULTISPECIES: heavy metal translocating P-type ATPase [Spongiibacter]|uniref:heavy metal translocating P-type ATPase n=1 Tax=Spongiibacter TaxID=630749 RepID=UPI000C3648D8|nr:MULTISPECIES: heavy metal translocating P-type ATPase [Spongiibacter]MAY39559.1 ATPase [Spongiibacter sp.]MBI58559.1 ATPase [Spongiibacter sp.]|tara:strand:+ start:7927 stop:10365 length:2439 start_codon:yes stop_codon:yes gene_type:complete
MGGCYHCGEPLPAKGHYSLIIDGQERAMCCPACVAVSETILGAGLDDYYRLRDQQASRPNDGAEDFLQYDSPAVFQQFSSSRNGLWQSQLSIGDMHCAACAWLIEHRLGMMDGVRSIRVNLQRGKATVEWDPATVKLSAVFDAIYRLGYGVQPWSAEGHLEQMREQQRGLLRRLGLAGVAMMQLMMVAVALYAGDFQGIDDDTRSLLRWFSLALATPVIAYSSQPFFKGAWRGLRSRRLGMDVPVSLALIAAYLASLQATVRGEGHVYFDTVSMFCFFLLLSRFIQNNLQLRREQTMRPLLPMTARKLLADGSNQWLALSALEPGDEIVVQPGEVVPVDATIIAGSSSVEDSAFTGEFMPKRKAVGELVLAGSHNIDGSLYLRVGAEVGQSRLSQIDQLLDSARLNRPPIAELADRLSGYFTLFVLFCSGAAFFYWSVHPGHSAFLTALAVLVVSCPCALSLATPSSYAAAISALRRRGALVANAAVLENLEHISHVIFDKTGTLTEGRPRLMAIERDSEIEEARLLGIASALELESSHPIAQAFARDRLADAGFTPMTLHASNLELRAGEGVEGDVDGQRYRIGSRRFCLPDAAEADDGNMTVYLVRDGVLLARFVLQDSLREEAKQAVSALQSRGIRSLLLSGDDSDQVAWLAGQLHFDEYRAACSAADKLARIRELQAQGATVMMVGDGVNDAPVIAAADVSIAMAAASDLTRSCADVALLSNRLSLIETVFEKAVQMRRVLRQNIFWALLYNGTALPAAAMGLVPPWLAALGMSASSLVVVLNALRLDRREQRAAHQAELRKLEEAGV